MLTSRPLRVSGPVLLLVAVLTSARAFSEGQTPSAPAPPPPAGPGVAPPASPRAPSAPPTASPPTAPAGQPPGAAGSGAASTTSARPAGALVAPASPATSPPPAAALVVIPPLNYSGSLPSFEVASVKKAPASNTSLRLSMGQGGRATLALPLKLLMQQVWNAKDYQIVGGPSWITSDRFLITAKAETDVPRDQVFLMMRALIIERFKLKFHIEQRPMNTYVLSRPSPDSPLGPGLKPVDCSGPRPPTTSAMLSAVPITSTSSSAPIRSSAASDQGSGTKPGNPPKVSTSRGDAAGGGWLTASTTMSAATARPDSDVMRQPGPCLRTATARSCR